eukprot:gene25562-11212_t
MSLPRETLKWILSLDLSYTVKNIRRDFCNGFLYAEILSRYFPLDVQMHSFENVLSIQRKKQNWALIEKLFKKKNIQVERSQIEAVISAKEDAAAEVLQIIYSFIHGPAYEETKEAEVVLSPGRLEELAVPRDQYADRGNNASPTPSAPPMIIGRNVAPAPVSSDVNRDRLRRQNSVHDTNYKPTGQQQQQQPRGSNSAGQFVQPSYAVNNGYAAQSAGPAIGGLGLGLGLGMHAVKGYAQQAALAQQQAANAQQQQMAFAQEYSDILGEGGSGDLDGKRSKSPRTSEKEGIAYSRKPRAVEDFHPYDQKDFDEKGYNKGSDKNYWELGRLGPDLETAELQAKRENQERIKLLAAKVRDDNLRKAQGAHSAAAIAAKREKEREPTKRERALAFAKSVPKPEPPKPKVTEEGKKKPEPPKPKVTVEGKKKPEPLKPKVTEEAPKKLMVAPGSYALPKMSELEMLEAKHRSDRDRVEAIRSELARML